MPIGTGSRNTRRRHDNERVTEAELEPLAQEGLVVNRSFVARTCFNLASTRHAT
jgi:hypothetical protein